MIFDNDKTIFKYLKPLGNEMISTFRGRDLDEFLLYLNNYYLEYRDSLGLDDEITFGIEIEIERFKCKLDKFDEFQVLINNVVGNDRWDTKNDISLYNYSSFDNKVIFGREIASDILTDNDKTWIDINNVCNIASLYGVIGDKCGAHVHVGAQILGDNTLYWYRFLKLLVIYENIIYRFLYGEYLTHRSIMMDKTKPGALFYDSKLEKIHQELDGGLFHMLKILNSGDNLFSRELKFFGISFWHMLCDDEYNLYDNYNVCNKYCTVECRAGNGTTNPIVWQNNINFFIKMLLYCKSERFNNDILDSRRGMVESMFGDISRYSEIYLEQAIEFCDMIFDNNIDKIYFLRQYLKSFEVSKKAFVKAKKFTV